MKYYIVAGEASGDLHGSNLIKNLKKIDKEARFRCFGGDLMQKAGAEIALHYKKMSFIGVVEVVKHLKTIRKTLEFCKKDILEFTPDAVILIDYPGFNLKIAEFVKSQGFKTLYYIAPKVWASRKSRIKRIRKSVDKTFAILPFEEEYFNFRRCNTEYVGNPLSDAIASFKPEKKEAFFKENKIGDKPVIALLAGSRTTEIKNCLPQMLKAIEGIENFEFVLAGAPSISLSYYKKYLQGVPVKIVYNKTYDLLSFAYAAIVVSGTATLETALFKVPEVVLYKVATASYMIGRPFVHIKFFSLVNIIMDQAIVKEFLQFRLARRIRTELNRLLYDQSYRQTMIDNFIKLTHKIGDPGTSERVSKSMYDYLTQ